MIKWIFSNLYKKPNDIFKRAIKIIKYKKYFFWIFIISDKNNKDFKYDIIFIDGLHHDYQVIRDIENSLNHLSDNGVIVCHDCLPFSEVMQRQEECYGEWTGDVWKAIAKFRIERTNGINNKYFLKYLIK